MTALISSSGGKDSILALERGRWDGLQVSTILMMFDEDGERSRSHGIAPTVARAQADAIGCQLVMPRASWSTYESVFVASLTQLKMSGHDQAIFGDIDLQPHRDWEEMVCERAGLTPVLPLWGQDRVALANEILESGIEAVVVCVDSRKLGDEFVGRRYDRSFLADLPDGVDQCGENGEFHTFVTNSRLFAYRLRVEVTGHRPFVAPAEFGGTRFCFADLKLLQSRAQPIRDFRKPARRRNVGPR